MNGPTSNCRGIALSLINELRDLYDRSFPGATVTLRDK